MVCWDINKHKFHINGWNIIYAYSLTGGENEMVLKELNENESIQWAKTTFIKWSTGIFILVGVVLILKATIGLGFDGSIEIGI